jgi:putative glycosyltransferase (TIGR04348 family)
MGLHECLGSDLGAKLELMHRCDIVIVTPALADANNGNWQTASRWARLLAPAYRVRLAASWDGGDEDLMIALHARRSAASIERWRQQRVKAPLALVLTGTDLYRDIRTDASAQRSLQSADRLVVLNELGELDLPERLRDKARVVLQSCAARLPQTKTGRHQRALMVGHLRDEKAPQTYFEAAALLTRRADLLFDHIGSALQAELGDAAMALMDGCPNYRWLGGLPRGAVRRRIQAAHVLVHASRMEGGANVLIEALRSGTPVLASRIPGNVGLLGDDYGGYFPVEDAPALARLLERARDEPGMLDTLQVQCMARADLFDPKRELQAVQALVAECLASRRDRPHPTTKPLPRARP